MENFYNFDINDFTEMSQMSPIGEEETADFCEEIFRDGKKYHHCTFPDCGKIFRFKSEFMRHKVIHVVSRPFTCAFDGCNKTFKREDALKNHLRIHTGEMPFQCDAPGCEMKFPTKAGLRYHMLKHKGEKMCVCSYPGCNKSFLTMAQLKQHESASNFHKKVTTTQAPTPAYHEPTPIYTKVEKEKDVYLNEFFAPEIKPAGKIEWEMKDQFDDDNSAVVNSDLQENFEKMVKVILKENSMLKQRLGMCNTLMSLMQENNDLKSKLTKNPSFTEPTIPDTSDEKIFQFLSFYDDKN